jgi:deazaflavin-dependent oxidoreductase (nitroreductase family)
MVEVRERVPIWIRAMNPLMKGMLRLGAPMTRGSAMRPILLTVRGRKSGQPRTTPLGMFEKDGRRWLFAEFGAVGWVRNLRVTGEASLRSGRRREDVTAAELAPAETAQVLHDVVAPWLRGPMGRMAGVMAGRPIFNVSLDAPLEEFISEAPRHPIFEVKSKGGSR